MKRQLRFLNAFRYFALPALVGVGIGVVSVRQLHAETRTRSHDCYQLWCSGAWCVEADYFALCNGDGISCFSTLC